MHTPLIQGLELHSFRPLLGGVVWVTAGRYPTPPDASGGGWGISVMDIKFNYQPVDKNNAVNMFQYHKLITNIKRELDLSFLIISI